MAFELDLGSLVCGRYHVDGLLGEGAFGCVYRAEQIDLRRPVALKVLRREWSGDPSVVERFTLEARMAARANHPNIVGVYEVGETLDGIHFIAMEMARGESLRALIARAAPLACARAVELLEQILCGLGAAHDNGIVHADLKPDNLIVTRAGGRDLIKIIDFGISSPCDNANVGTRTLCGTPAYMAPELAGGAVPTMASDLYAAGIILYELLTGEVPFAGDSATEVLTRHVRDPFAVPARLRGLVSRDLETFLRRALAKNPDDRFATAEHMRAALDVARGDAGDVVESSAERSQSSRARVTVPQVMTHSSRECAGISRRVDLLHRRIAHAIRGGSAETLVRAYAELADLLLSAGERARAAAELVEGLSMVDGAGTPVDPSPLLVRLAEIERLCGDQERAAKLARAAYRRADRAGRLLARNRARALLNQLAP